MKLLERVERLQTGQPEDISRFAASLDPEWIEEALRATGKSTMRRRKMPADKAVWLVLGMALFSNRSIQRVVEHLGLVIDGLIAPSAIARARQRLGSEPLRALFNRIAKAWGHTDENTWKGLSLYGLDGTHVSVSDSDVNDEHFGRQQGRSASGYPLMRIVGLMNLTTRLLTGCALGCWDVGEVTLAKQLWPLIPENSLTIIDRGFLSLAIFWEVIEGAANRHFLIRLRSNSAYKVVTVLPDGSALAVIRHNSTLKKKYPEAARPMTVRLIAYSCPQSGKDGILMTSLLDHKTCPGAELLALYHKRWELEIAFDEIKTHMLNEHVVLRSRTVEGTYQEIWGTLTLYNLLRREMASVAQSQDLPPNRISFTGALLLVQNFFISALTAAPGVLPKELAELEYRMGRTMILPPRRSQRRCPRQVKVKMSSYPKAPGRARKVALTA